MKENNKKIISVFLIIAMLSALFSAIYWVFVIVPNEIQNEEIETKYLVNIKTKSDENYIVMVPVIVDENGSIARVMNCLKITNGRGNFSIENTPYGWIMKIEGRGNLTITGSARYFIESERLSIINDSWPGGGNTSIYSSISGINIYVGYHSIHIYEKNHMYRGNSIIMQIRSESTTRGWYIYEFIRIYGGVC